MRGRGLGTRLTWLSLRSTVGVTSSLDCSTFRRTRWMPLVTRRIREVVGEGSSPWMVCKCRMAAMCILLILAKLNIERAYRNVPITCKIDTWGWRGVECIGRHSDCKRLWRYSASYLDRQKQCVSCAIGWASHYLKEGLPFLGIELDWDVLPAKA